MPVEDSPEVKFEIGHVLFMDIVGYSKLVIDKQTELTNRLNEIVRNTQQFRLAESENALVRLPTGDGMALVFRNSPEAPAQSATEIAAALREHPEIKLRMGIHSGPVNQTVDVNNRTNIAGAGINIAQRIMDCGDTGHILLSKRVADDLENYARWRRNLHDLGEVEVKHGVKIHVVNFQGDGFGNPTPPTKFSERAPPSGKIPAWQRSRWLVPAAIVLLLVAIVGTVLFFRLTKQRVLPAFEKSVAVLPLENLTEEKENAYFADGIQDELLSNLSKIKDLKVISRTSVMQYKTGITRNLKEIAQQLGVSNVVEGSVRRSGNHVRVSVQLIDALTDRHIWAQNYDRTLADSLALQGELATEIAAGVGATLSPQEKARVEATPTKNAAAYDAYLRGRVFTTSMQNDRSNLEGAIRSYQEAVKLDASFTLAWVYLSCSHSSYYWSGADPSPARLAAAKEALDRAIALDPNLPETHLALGYYRYYGQRDFKGALAEFELAEKSLPNNVDVLNAIGLIHRRLGHWKESIAVLRRAVELDPRNTSSAGILATTDMIVRHFSDALAMADHILAVEPANQSALGIKLSCFWATGNVEAAEAVAAKPNADPSLRGFNALAMRRYSEAADILAKALNDNPDQDKTGLLFALGLAQQRAGNVSGARATYQQAVQELQRQLGNSAPGSGEVAELHSNLGIAYAGLGDAASAVADGQKGIAGQASSEDPFGGPEREEAMAQIYALLGDADHAIPILRRLVQIPSSTEITPALMRLDPIWDPIRNDPRFQELVAEKNAEPGK